MKPPASAASMAIDHYENFPVASWLCPPHLRPAVAAIYWFARTADDLADEGDAAAGKRLDDLAAYRADLRACAAGDAPSSRWLAVFTPLAEIIVRHALPVQLLEDLLSAFEQDVRKTESRSGYTDRAELLDYCRRSANPVGRLLLHLQGVRGDPALVRSDSICTALQLINCWQDLSIDVPRGRYYLPADQCQAFGLEPSQPATWQRHHAARECVAAQVQWARATMLHGSPLVHRVPGRAGWELRLVVQGGLRVLDRIAAQRFDTFSVRPRLRLRDAPVIAWRSLWM